MGDTRAQTPPRRNSQSVPRIWIEEALNNIKADFQDFKQDIAKTTQTLRDYAITLTTYGTSLASLFETQNKQQREITQMQNSNSSLTQDLINQTQKITQLEKTVEALTISTEDLTSKNLALQGTLKDIKILKSEVASQNEIIETLNNKPSANSTQIIQTQVQAHINTLNTQLFWQRELDRSANQLVFKNLRKTPNTFNMHPREIFITNILEPMNLNTEDEAKITPISVFDTNKGKDNANTHFLICTFSSLQAISLIKQNAKKIPKQVMFCPRVPLQYTSTLNEFLKTQGQIRLLRDKNGIPLSKTKITTNKRHLVLEKSDRVKDSFSPFYPIDSFIPQTNGSVPSITPTPYLKTHALIQCRWDDPVYTVSKEVIKAHLEKAKMEHASFNHTSHLLNITTMTNVLDQTLEYLRSNPILNASKVNSSAF